MPAVTCRSTDQPESSAEQTGGRYDGHPRREGLLVRSLRRRDLRLWRCRVLRVAWGTSEQTDCRDGRHSRRKGLLVGGVGRGHLFLRLRGVLRVDGKSSPQQTSGRHDVHCVWQRILVRSLDGGVFAYGDAGFYGSTGSIRLNEPSSVCLLPLAAAATGSWRRTGRLQLRLDHVRRQPGRNRRHRCRGDCSRHLVASPFGTDDPGRPTLHRPGLHFYRVSIGVRANSAPEYSTDDSLGRPTCRSTAARKHSVRRR